MSSPSGSRRRLASRPAALPCLVLLAARSPSSSHARLTPAPATESSYGVDVSYPVHSYPAVQGALDGNPLGDKQTYYDHLLEGCREKYGGACDESEDDRVGMNLLQPRNVVNFTETGYSKLRLPSHAFSMLREYWDKNKDSEVQELWGKGDMTCNSWEAEQRMVSLENRDLRSIRGGSKKEMDGYAIKDVVWDAVQEIATEWTGQALRPCSLYGIRVYHEGSVLSPHIDRFPLVTSAIVNVAQDVDEPWPLEVYGRDGKAVNITMEPGDLVLYESHSLIHGRPFPLKGRYMANVFVHFEPKAMRDDGFPVYLKADAPDAIVDTWRAQVAENAGEGLEESQFLDADGNSLGNSESDSIDEGEEGSNEAHLAAGQGDTDLLLDIAEDSADDLHATDANGWKPIHEAARGGHREAIELLLEHGADINDRTNFGEGHTPLRLVVSEHGADHPLVSFLRGLGALDVGPEF